MNHLVYKDKLKILIRHPSFYKLPKKYAVLQYLNVFECKLIV